MGKSNNDVMQQLAACNHQNWTHTIDAHVFDDAQVFLTLTMDDKDAADVSDEFQKNQTTISHYRPADLVRAAKLPMLPINDPDVALHLKEIDSSNVKLCPVLVIRGNKKRPACIADGYHRTCAGFYTDPHCEIPVVIIDAK